LGVARACVQIFFIKTEKNRFLQLLDHIASNAVNSMLSEGGQLVFDSKLVMKGPNNFIQISITDSGTGLTTEESNHIFDEFYKADEARHDLKSSGLGLSICKRIVEKHGGKIWADSPGVGKGSTFYFTLKSGSEK